MGHAVLTNRYLDFHTRIIDLTQHLNHSAYCLTVTIGVINNFHTDHLTQFSVELPLGRYQDIVTNTLVFWGDN